MGWLKWVKWLIIVQLRVTLIKMENGWMIQLLKAFKPANNVIKAIILMAILTVLNYLGKLNWMFLMFQLKVTNRKLFLRNKVNLFQKILKKLKVIIKSVKNIIKREVNIFLRANKNQNLLFHQVNPILVPRMMIHQIWVRSTITSKKPTENGVNGSEKMKKILNLTQKGRRWEKVQDQVYDN